LPTSEHAAATQGPFDDAGVDNVRRGGSDRDSPDRPSTVVVKDLDLATRPAIETKGLAGYHLARPERHEAVQVLGQHLAHYQAIGDLRPDFDPNVMAVAIRAATDAVLQRYVRDPDLDVDNYSHEIVSVFDRATAPRTPRGGVDTAASRTSERMRSPVQAAPTDGKRFRAMTPNGGRRGSRTPDLMRVMHAL
jgi:hypothetical protein